MRWFWYISIPKILHLESQNYNLLSSVLDGFPLSLELTTANIKAKISQEPAAFKKNLIRRISKLENRIRRHNSVPSASQLNGHRPVFFSFEGVADRFIHEFYCNKPPETPGEDFYPAGAFVVAGVERNVAVVLIGNANNAYGIDFHSKKVTWYSQTPIAFLHRLTDDLDEMSHQWGKMNPARMRQIAFEAYCHVVSHTNIDNMLPVKSLAIFGAKVDVKNKKIRKLPSHMTHLPPLLNVVEYIVVGSPIYVEQVAGVAMAGNDGL